MKWPARILDTVRIRHHSGMSLVELVIVLGISSLLVAGSLAWFQSRGGTVFYNQMRQIDSYIREVQSEADSQYVQGYSGDVANCAALSSREALGSSCPLKAGEQVFGTAIVAQVPVGTSPTTLTSVRLKRNNSILNPGVELFTTGHEAGKSLTLDASIKFAGYYADSATTGCSSADRNWLTIPAPQKKTAAGDTAAIVFRQQPRTLYALANAGFTNSLLAYGIDDPTLASIGRSCSLLLRFESFEQLAGQPRYSAEVHAQPSFGTLRLQTR